jgi:hypothetical protein
MVHVKNPDIALLLYMTLEEIQIGNLAFFNGKRDPTFSGFGWQSAPVFRHLTQILHAPFNPMINVA